MPEQTSIRFKSHLGHWLVHPDLRDRMIEDAREKGTSLSDLANLILAAHFGVRYEPTNRRSQPREVIGEQFKLHLPPDLERVLAAAYPGKSADGIRYVLCAHYGLRVPPKPKLTRAPRRPRVA
jgi:hypothetical protein